MVDFNFKIDIKPVSKIIDILSIGCGQLYSDFIKQPLQISRAKKNPELLIEYQKNDYIVSNKKLGSLIDSEQASQSITQYRENIALKNQADAINIAYSELKGVPDEEISDENIDEDWVHRWFNSVEFISSDDLKIIWGKLLAGEIKQPGSYSLRTLEFLKNISTAEALLIQRLFKFVLNFSETYWFYEDTVDNTFYTYFESQILSELGLIQSNTSLFGVFNEHNRSSVRIANSNILVGAQKTETSSEHPFSANRLTQVGTEVYKILNLPELSDQEATHFLQKYRDVLQSHFILKNNEFAVFAKDNTGNFVPI